MDLKREIQNLIGQDKRLKLRIYSKWKKCQNFESGYKCNFIRDLHSYIYYSRFVTKLF